MNKLEDLYIQKDNIDSRILRLTNQIRIENSRKRKKDEQLKRKLAKIFLSSKYKLLHKDVLFNAYEIFTLGGLIILNELQNYKSTILVAAYNIVCQKALDDKNYFAELKNNASLKYLEDRKIRKDIEEYLQIMYSIIIEAKKVIETSNITNLDFLGSRYFTQRKKNNIEKKLDQLNKILQ